MLFKNLCKNMVIGYKENKMTEKDKKIQDLKRQLEFIKEYIEEKCVYDEHLQGYCFDLKAGDVRTLMLKLKGKKLK